MKLLINVSFFIFLTGSLFQLCCQKKFLCPDCDTNKVPIANAGADQITTLPKDSVILDGTTSSDADGTITSYKWLKISGPVSSNIVNATSSITVVKTLMMGIYKFELTVTDNGGLSAKDTVQIIVDNPLVNQPPVANAGNDQTIILPTDSASLNGNSSFDPDGTIVSYSWLKILGPSSITILTPNTSQTKVKSLVQGVYKFELTVTDNGGLSAKDTLQIIVNTPTTINLPPVANAGASFSANYDLQICSLGSAITLNGSASADPDGTIVSYLWTGPGMISNATSAICQVTGLAVGAYVFSLLVTDNNGASANDTVSVNVSGINRPLIPAQLVPISTLSFARTHMAVASAGNKILFAGGTVPVGISGIDPRKEVDIFDVTTNNVMPAQLSEARHSIGAVGYGNKIFFAGGITNTSMSSRIDIYDVSTNSWTIKELSIARNPSAATAADNVVFAGGVEPFSFNDMGYSRVDIYNATTNVWSTDPLIGAGRNIGATTTLGNKIYFAGGYEAVGLHDIIDIYDAVTHVWTTSKLSQYKSAMAGIAVNNKIYWAGGDVYNTPGGGQQVEIRDVTTSTTTFGCLFQQNSGSSYGMNSSFDAVVKNNKIVFFTSEGGYGFGEIKNKFDIYDISTNTWSIGVLSQNIFGASIICVNNIIYVAGGYVNGILSNQIWRLDF